MQNPNCTLHDVYDAVSWLNEDRHTYEKRATEEPSTKKPTKKAQTPKTLKTQEYSMKDTESGYRSWLMDQQQRKFE